jgi:hypothetical protein
VRVRVLNGERVGGKTVAVPRHRVDERPAVRVGSEHFSQHENRRRQVRLLDEAVGPDDVHQLGLVDDAIAPLDQGQKNVERLGSGRTA